MELKEALGNKCNGLIYRAKVNHYATDDEIVLEIRLRKLKKKSCQGCEKCDWLQKGLVGFVRIGLLKKYVMWSTVNCILLISVMNGGIGKQEKSRIGISV